MCTDFYIILRPSCLHAGDIGKPNQTNCFDLFLDTCAYIHVFQCSICSIVTEIFFSEDPAHRTDTRRICAGRQVFAADRLVLVLLLAQVFFSLLHHQVLQITKRDLLGACFCLKRPSSKSDHSIPIAAYNALLSSFKQTGLAVWQNCTAWCSWSFLCSNSWSLLSLYTLHDQQETLSSHGTECIATETSVASCRSKLSDHQVKTHKTHQNVPFFLPWPQHQNGCNGSPATSYCTAIITQCSQQSRSCCCMQRKPNKVEVALRHVSGHIFAHLATRCLFHLLLQKLHIFPPPRYCVHMQCQT